MDRRFIGSSHQKVQDGHFSVERVLTIRRAALSYCNGCAAGGLNRDYRISGLSATIGFITTSTNSTNSHPFFGQSGAGRAFRSGRLREDCAGCHPVALVTPAALLKLGLSPAVKVLDTAMRVTVAAVER
jgi:hypothetical protein